MNADRGRPWAMWTSNARACPFAHRRAAARPITRSARTRWQPGVSSRRSSGDVTANGGFATTRNGRRGRRRSAASTCTTTTDERANRCRRMSARVGCSSTAMTRAPASTSGSVSAPVPAPMSTTRSPGRTPDSATRRCAAVSVSRCHPQRGRRFPAGTTHHHRHHRRSMPRAFRLRRRFLCRRCEQGN
jgi:hypothetical protein